MENRKHAQPGRCRENKVAETTPCQANNCKNQVKDESKNNPVVLFFWGSNCPYCDDQKPIIEDLEKEYKNTGVSFY